MMTDKTLREFIESASSQVEKLFRARGQVLPMWHAIQADGNAFVMPAPSTDKDAAAALVRALFEIKNVVRCMFIDEAWITKLTPDEWKEIRDSRGSLLDHPKRVEVVVFAAEDGEAGSLTGSCAIIRPAKGRAYLGPLEIDVYDSSEGRLVGMLPRRGATVQ